MEAKGSDAAPEEEPGEGKESQRITAGRDAFVAGRDQFVINVNVPQATQDEPSQSQLSQSQPGQSEPGPSDEPGAGADAGGLGKHLFTARLLTHSSQLSVAFGANNTLV